MGVGFLDWLLSNGVVTVLSLSLLGLAANSQAASTDTVKLLRQDWKDEKRDRVVPVLVYYPGEVTTQPLPIIIVSHGLGGTREGMAYLGRAWAKAGYVSVHVQHAGSDDNVWRGVPVTEMASAMGRAAADTNNAVQRSLDVQFAIDELFRLQDHEGVLKGRLNLHRIGIAGHSFGAFTTLAIAGQSFPGFELGAVQLEDKRVSAALALSPVPPQVKTPAHLKSSYAHVAIPCMHMTGTKDVSMLRDTEAEDRRLPFDYITGVDQYLITFADGDHGMFSGRERLGAADLQDERNHKLIAETSTAFWNAYLKEDPEALKWLRDSAGARQLLKGAAVLELKTAKADGN